VRGRPPLRSRRPGTRRVKLATGTSTRSRRMPGSRVDRRAPTGRLVPAGDEAGRGGLSDGRVRRPRLRVRPTWRRPVERRGAAEPGRPGEPRRGFGTRRTSTGAASWPAPAAASGCTRCTCQRPDNRPRAIRVQLVWLARLASYLGETAIRTPTSLSAATSTSPDDRTSGIQRRSWTPRTSASRTAGASGASTGVSRMSTDHHIDGGVFSWWDYRRDFHQVVGCGSTWCW